jgi:hypothetical protein
MILQHPRRALRGALDRFAGRALLAYDVAAALWRLVGPRPAPRGGELGAEAEAHIARLGERALRAEAARDEALAQAAAHWDQLRRYAQIYEREVLRHWDTQDERDWALALAIVAGRERDALDGERLRFRAALDSALQALAGRRPGRVEAARTVLHAALAGAER